MNVKNGKECSLLFPLLPTFLNFMAHDKMFTCLQVQVFLLDFMFSLPCIPEKSLQIRPTRCTILFNIFSSLLYMFPASMCPSSGENYCIYATLVFISLYGWCLVCWLDWKSNQQQSAKYQCRIDTVIFSWWRAHGCPKRVEKRNKYIKQNRAPSCTYLQRFFFWTFRLCFRINRHHIFAPSACTYFFKQSYWL